MNEVISLLFSAAHKTFYKKYPTHQQLICPTLHTDV